MDQHGDYRMPACMVEDRPASVHDAMPCITGWVRGNCSPGERERDGTRLRVGGRLREDRDEKVWEDRRRAPYVGQARAAG